MSLQRSSQIQAMQKILNQAEMLESEGIQAIFNQAAIQAVTTAIVVQRDANVGPWSAAKASLRQPQRLRHGRLALEKLSFHWNAQYRHTELLNFEIEVTNILETTA